MKLVNHDSKLDALFLRLEKLERGVQRDRLWDIISKLMVPVVLAAGAVLIKHEVALAGQFSLEDAVKMEQRIMEKTPPTWLRESLQEIKVLLQKQDDRLRLLEQRVK